jgi:small conductance mechanosensitive channel
VGALVLLVLGWLVYRLLFRPIRRMLERSRLGPIVVGYLAALIQTAFAIVLILAVLHQLGVQTVSLVTLLGAAGLALALSLQGVLSNFTSGLLLFSYRMFRVGDLIEVGELRGRVSEMLPFHLVLTTPDNQKIMVPNSMLTGGAVRNNSAFPHRRVQWTLAIKPQDELSVVREALRTCLLGRAGVLAEPPPHIHVQEWTDDKRVLAITAWTSPENVDNLRNDTLEELGRCLEDVRKNSPKP